MSGQKNILVLTHWSFQDALIQTYTLPYVRLIRKNIASDRKIILVTFEQDHLLMNTSLRKEKEVELNKEGIQLLTLKYSRINFLFPFKAAGYFFLNKATFVGVNK